MLHCLQRIGLAGRPARAAPPNSSARTTPRWSAEGCRGARGDRHGGLRADIRPAVFLAPPRGSAAGWRGPGRRAPRGRARRAAPRARAWWSQMGWRAGLLAASAIVALVLPGAAHAADTTVNFDGFSAATTITTQYADLGGAGHGVAFGSLPVSARPASTPSFERRRRARHSRARTSPTSPRASGASYSRRRRPARSGCRTRTCPSASDGSARPRRARTPRPTPVARS